MGRYGGEHSHLRDEAVSKIFSDNQSRPKGEREPLSEYCRYVSAKFGIRCTVTKVASCYGAEHVATLEFLDVIEPPMQTDNKKRRITEARKLYAERGFRFTFLPKEERMRRLGGSPTRPKRESRPVPIF